MQMNEAKPNKSSGDDWSNWENIGLWQTSQASTQQRYLSNVKWKYLTVELVSFNCVKNFDSL